VGLRPTNLVIDLSAAQVIKRDHVDQDPEAVELQHGVVIRLFVGESHSIGKPAAAAAADVDANRVDVFVGLGDDFEQFVLRRCGDFEFVQRQARVEFAVTGYRGGFNRLGWRVNAYVFHGFFPAVCNIAIIHSKRRLQTLLTICNLPPKLWVKRRNASPDVVLSD